MPADLLAKLAPLSGIFVPIAAALAMGIGSRRRFGKAKRRAAAEICEDASLKVFLPCFVIESISRTAPSFDLFLAFGVGFLLPPLALAGMWLYKQAVSGQTLFTPRYPDLRFLVSTYGGGNRGTALFVLLFANSPHFAENLKWFSLVDLGNFCFQLFVTSYMVARHYGTPKQTKRGLVSSVTENYAVVTLLLVTAYFSLRHYLPSVENLLAETVDARRFLFSFLVFLAITLRFEHAALKDTFLLDVVGFIVARLFTGLCAVALLYPFLPDALPICLSVVILVLMPPSSFLPSIIGQSDASDSTLAYVNGFTGAANVFYIGLIALGIVMAVFHAVQ